MGIPGDMLIPGKWEHRFPHFRENGDPGLHITRKIWEYGGPSEWESPVWLTIFPGVWGLSVWHTILQEYGDP